MNNRYESNANEAVRLANTARAKNDAIERQNAYFEKKRRIEKEKRRKAIIDNIKRKVILSVVVLATSASLILGAVTINQTNEKYGKPITEHYGSSNNSPESYFIIDGEKISANKIYFEEFLELAGNIFDAVKDDLKTKGE